jgi:hypothetical protein
MPRDSKAYYIRLLFWIAAIFIVARPLRSVRSEIGDIAYVVGALLVLVVCHLVGRMVANRVLKADT